MFLEESPMAVIARFQQSAPVMVNQIAEALGLPIFFRDLGRSVSAALQRRTKRPSRSGFVIYINQADSPVRQRFSLAHEIAHFVLHRDLIEQGVTDDTMYRSAELNSYYEVQANQLAADILMPVRLVRQYGIPLASVSLMARQFQVSKKAMEIRLNGLKIPNTP